MEPTEPKATRTQGETSFLEAAAPATTNPTSPGMTKSSRTALSPNDTPRTATHSHHPPRRATASRMLEPTGSSAGPQALAAQLGVIGHQPAEVVLDDLACGVPGQALHEHDVAGGGESAPPGRPPGPPPLRASPR